MSELAKLLGNDLGVMFLLSFPFALLMLLVGYPILAFRAVGHLKRIGQQLDRLNATLEAKITITKSGPLGL